MTLPITTNFSPFCVSVRMRVDASAQQYYVVVLGASFESPPGQALRAAAQQSPLSDVDVFRGDPDASSLRYDADLADHKAAIDVVVNGHAYAPQGRTATRVQVGVSVDGLMNKRLNVSGDRFWRGGALGRVASAPAPFTKLPVVYERAFGGSSPEGHDASNPVGLGFKGAPSADAEVRSDLPNIEHADGSRVAGAAPAGFGFVARSWAPRLQHAGRYDSDWLDRQFPLLPVDFDMRFHQAAPLDQQLRALSGGEVFQVFNMTPQGRWAFRLPQLDVPLQFRFADRLVDEAFRLDTVVLEPDTYRILLRGRCRLPVIRQRAPLEEVVVGHATPAWWIARVSRKRYLSGPGRSGRLPGAAYWRL